MQANTSFVILDPKGEIVRDVGKLLEAKGYEIKVLDLISMEKSHCYNPFVYLQNDNDMLLRTLLMNMLPISLSVVLTPQYTKVSTNSTKQVGKV